MFEKVCEIKQIDADMLMKQMEKNYYTLFKKAKK